jgi:glutamate-5-semialdehyde dehydrogenase
METKITNEVIEKGKKAKTTSLLIQRKTTEQKNEALLAIADQLNKDRHAIFNANTIDIQNGKANGLEKNVLDRILLTDERIDAIIHAIEQCVHLYDPIGDELENIKRDDGLHIIKKRVPIGVIGIIYEARPNVTIDAAMLCIKTNNAVILRGSSSAIESNKALVASIQSALQTVNYPIDSVQLIEDTSRETAKTLFTLNEYLDVLIPRGSSQLINTVVKSATVPVIETGAGNCHIFIDEAASYEKAIAIVKNAKLQRPSVCNACESLLIHEKFFTQYGATFIQDLLAENIELFGDEHVCSLSLEVVPATNDHYAEEFLRLALSIKVVPSVEEAIHHIHQFGTKHSEAIITEDHENAQLFLQNVDAAAVYHNASTRFTDGFEFGYGAEIGISTQKLHARGPMGLEALTSSKYFIFGNGHIRS